MKKVRPGFRRPGFYSCLARKVGYPAPRAQAVSFVSKGAGVGKLLSDSDGIRYKFLLLG